MVALQVLADLALDFPRKGMHIGGGAHAPMPDTWNGQGETPPGWTKTAQVPWVASATDAVFPISDGMAAQIQQPGAQGRLSAAQQLSINGAIAARANVDLEAGNYIPKANAAVAAGPELGASNAPIAK